jgi:putative membrane protein
MLMHMVVVAVAAPLLVRGVCGSAFDPVARWSVTPSAVVASMVEFVAVWAWHAPALHHAARTTTRYLLLEQGTFLLCGVLLWLSAWGGTPAQRLERVPGGVIGLLLTSMHMTLLGALIALARRPLYSHAHSHAHTPSGLGPIDPLVDQQIGGAIMLFLGAAVYLMGGLLLAKEMLARRELERG